MTSEKFSFHFLMFFGRGDKNEKLGNGLKLSLLLWIIFLQVRLSCERKKCEIKECESVAEKCMKCGFKECESTNCFRKCGIKDCDPSIFREMRNQKLRGFIQKLEKFILNDANFSMRKLHQLA